VANAASNTSKNETTRHVVGFTQVFRFIVPS
jgi:hypothetical protein